jgi:hypothetical protein
MCKFTIKYVGSTYSMLIFFFFLEKKKKRREREDWLIVQLLSTSYLPLNLYDSHVGHTYPMMDLKQIRVEFEESWIGKRRKKNGQNMCKENDTINNNMCLISTKGKS